MDMCYDGALVMPSSYAVMDEEEMMYLEGGSKDGINIGMFRSYLSKQACIDQARGIIRTKGWKNVTSGQLAKEIYGHAVVYYRFSILGKLPVAKDVIYSHVADGVDLENAVDRHQNVWNIIWNTF